MSAYRPSYLIFALGGAFIFAPTTRAKPVDFSREIQPILSDKCYPCHGPDAAARKSGLRLDRRIEAFAGGKSGLVTIVPGRPDDSELIARIFSHDSEEVMPAADSNNPLTTAQKNLLRRWVAEGAAWGEHWAYVAPDRSPSNRVRWRG